MNSKSKPAAKPAGALITRASRSPTARSTVTPAGLAAIEAMSAEGQDQRTIAKRLGIDHKTLRDIRDRDPAVALAWERGHGDLASELTHILLTHAREGNIIAAIYLTKARLGWREGTPAEGAGAPSVQVNIQIPPPMSPAEFAAIIEGTAEPVPPDAQTDAPGALPGAVAQPDAPGAPPGANGGPVALPGPDDAPRGASAPTRPERHARPVQGRVDR